MREKIRIGVVGYGNLGKGVIRAIEKNNDMELKAIFTRREGILELICQNKDLCFVKCSIL